jgi:hypothetical protein
VILAKKKEKSIGSKVLNIFNYAWAIFFSLYLLYQGLQYPNGARVHFGIFLLFGSFAFCFFTQYPNFRKWSYEMQMKWYRKMVSEEQIKRNGLVSTLALATISISLILAGTF